MSLRFLTLLLLSFLGVFSISAAHASGYQVTDIVVNVQAADAVKARDLAILQAQRLAFAVLVGKSDKDVAKVTDTQIGRLVSDFSIKNERLAVRSYAAVFTVRFEPNRTQSFIQSQGFDLVNQELATMTGDTTVSANEAVIPVQPQAIVILPVLDIGSRQTVWDDPNPWREVWQKKDHSIKGLPVKVPLGDIVDIADIPDTKFLTSDSRANVANLLGRYMANTMYVVVAKNQGAALDPSGGMAISLYRHDGTTIKFLKKLVLHPRPGYAFVDAVPAALNMIVMAENTKSDQEETQIAEEAQDEADENEAVSWAEDAADEQTAILGTAAASPAPMIVTIPYQNLPQWVNIQRRLRSVPGVVNIVTIRVAPSSAEVQIITAHSSVTMSQNFATAGFELQAMPNGEVALLDR